MGGALSRRVLRLRLPAPLDAAGTLAVLGTWGDDLLDRWDGRTARRTLRVAGTDAAYAVTVTGGLREPEVEVDAPAQHVDAVVDAVRRTFPGDPEQLDALAARDAVVARCAAARPGLRPCGYPDGLRALVRAVSAQQVSLFAATAMRRRLAVAHGRPLPVAGDVVHALDPAVLAGLTPEDYRSLGFTRRKGEYLAAAARADLDGRLAPDRLAALPLADALADLQALRGVGRWSAEWLMVRVTGAALVVAGDLVVRKAVGAGYGLGALPSEDEVRAATAHWGPAAALAQQALLAAWGAGLLGDAGAGG